MRDDIRSAPLLVAQLGMAVEVATERDQIVCPLRDLLAPFRARLAHPGVSSRRCFYAAPMLRRRGPRCQPSRVLPRLSHPVTTVGTRRGPGPRARAGKLSFSSVSPLGDVWPATCSRFSAPWKPT